MIEHLLLSLLTFLQSELLGPSLLMALRSGILQSSLLTSLQSKFILTSPLAPLWKIFLRRLYKDIPTVTRIYSKPEIILQYIRGFVNAPKQVKPEASKSWLPLHSSLQSYTLSSIRPMALPMFV